MAGIFSLLPGDFFSPLTSPNRETYAACLLIFHDLFRDSPGGVERSALAGRFAEYLAQSGESFIDEDDAAPATEDLPRRSAGNAVTGSEAAGSAGNVATRDETVGETATRSFDPDRAEASRILRKLIASGWMGEETLPDYTRLVTLPARAKPFLDALNTTREGGSVEYESHIVAIYSSLCGDAARDYGHHAVLNAHHHLTLLVDSLKVLSQNIRMHYERLLEESQDAGIPDILRLHYDHYLEEVVDRAYARLKTSDNLSRYRPRIQRTVNAFRHDRKWMEKTAAALASIRREPVPDARERLTAMLDDIVSQLKALDPSLDEIDRRNMLYARSSLERIRARLRSDSTTAGRLGTIARAAATDAGIAGRLAHHLYRAGWLGKESRYLRTFRQEPGSFTAARPERDVVAMERAEAELRLRIAKQLTPERIAAWLDEKMGSATFIYAQELATDAENFVRVLHATAYGEGRPARFPFAAEWEDGEVAAAGWLFRAHGYRRRR